MVSPIEDLGVEETFIIPADSHVNELDALGQPLIHLNGDSPVLKAVEALTDKIQKTI